MNLSVNVVLREKAVVGSNITFMMTVKSGDDKIWTLVQDLKVLLVGEHLPPAEPPIDFVQV